MSTPSNKRDLGFDLPTKHCSGCDEVKPTTDFHRKRASRDGLQG